MHVPEETQRKSFLCSLQLPAGNMLSTCVESGPCPQSLGTHIHGVPTYMVTSTNDAPPVRLRLKYVITARSQLWPDVGEET